ncbi:type II secretion system protein [Pseudomonadota bacterium]
MGHLFNNNINNKKGFSLIELSIVLIIIGLLVAGITSGLALVRAARISYGKKLAYNFSLEFEVSIPTPVLWLDANDNSTVVTDSDDNVSKWRDKSRSGNDASQANSANQPSHSLNGFNGRPSIHFNSSNSEWIAADSIGYVATTSHSYFIVFNASDNASLNESAIMGFHTSEGFNAEIIMLDTSNNGYIYHQDANRADLVQEDRRDLNNILYVEYDAAAFEAIPYLNGVLKTQIVDGVPAASALLTIGGEWDAALMTNFLEGDIAEIIVFDEVLTTIQRQLVEEYLNKKWKVY